MAIDFHKLVAEADGDWEYLFRSWNNDPDNIVKGDLIDETRARNAVSKMRGGRSITGISDRYDSRKLTAGKVVGDFWKAGTSPETAPEFFDLQKTMSIFLKPEGGIKGPGSILKGIGSTIEEEAVLYFQQTSDLLTEINEKTGLTGRLSADFRREIELAQPFAISLGISWKELSEMVSDTVAQSGKFKLLDTETINQMSLASKFIDNVRKIGEYARNFEMIGLGVGDMSRYIQQASMSSLQMGINARTVTSLINTNIKELNAYGFKNGVEGLSRMAQKSVEFRMNMNDAFKFAEKVWDPDKALELVANLQVLGGAYGDLNDPLKLMYMATNNVEGLQDAIIEASKSLATFNEEQGRFEVTGVNLRRAKAMADEMGMSMEELTNTAIAAAERVQASTDLMSRGWNIDEEDKEFLTNLSRMEGGRMVISIPENLQDQFKGTTVALDEMTATQAKMILDQKDAFKELSVEDYARQQVTALENLRRDVSFIRAAVRVSLGQKIGEALENLTGGLNTEVPEETKRLRNTVYGMMERKGLTEGMLGGTSEKEMLSQVVHLQAEQNNHIKALVNKENIKKEETPITPKEAPATRVIHESTITIRSLDSATDPIKRMLISDPVFVSDVKNGYLEEINSKK